MEKKLENFFFVVFFVTLMAPLSMEVVPGFRVYLFDFQLFALYVCLFMRTCMRRAHLHFGAFDFVFLLFFAWSFYCSMVGENFENSFPWLWLWLRGYFIIFYMRHVVGGFVSEKLLFAMIGLSLIVEPGLAIIQTLTQSSFGVVQQYFGVLKARESGWLYEGSRVTRAQGTFMHTNFFGNWLVMLMPFLQARMTDSNQRLRRGYTLWWFGCLVSLILTLSRANWMAFMLGSLAVLFAERRYRKLWSNQRRLMAYIITPFLLIGMAYALFPEEIGFLMELVYARAERTFDDKSSNIRSDLLTGAWTVLGENYVTGVGLGNSKIMIMESNPFIPSWFRATVHNIYLIVATESGIIGFVLFLMLNLWPFFRILKMTRYYNANMPRETLDNAIGFIGGFVGLGFAMLWYVGMFNESEFPLIMLLVGAALGVSSNLQRRALAWKKENSATAKAAVSQVPQAVQV